MPIPGLLKHLAVSSAETWAIRLFSLSRMRLVGTFGVVAVLFGYVHSAIAGNRIHTQKVHVRFLATGTLVRSNWGYNQDIYLAEMSSSTGGELRLIRLIDEYPSYSPPLAKSVLTSQAGTTFKLVRDSECDLAYAAMVLRTAPGDPSAMLPERLGYQPQIDHMPESSTLLPCYRTVRR